MRAVLIPVDVALPICEVQIDGSLEDLQGLVGGHIETVPFPGRVDVAPFFNEEGKMMGLPPNRRATQMLAGAIFPGDYIAGDMVLTGMDEEGENVDCPLRVENEVVSR